MDFLAENMAAIFAAVTSICGAIIGITSLTKVLKSEKRTKTALNNTNQDVKITREGIVQAFKNSVVTKDLKISINTQVQKILETECQRLQAIVNKAEERKTKMTYWCLKILAWTAASGKLTPEQKVEIDELMAMIANEEQIVDTDLD